MLNVTEYIGHFLFFLFHNQFWNDTGSRSKKKMQETATVSMTETQAFVPTWLNTVLKAERFSSLIYC